MIYLSKGVVCDPSTEDRLVIERGGRGYILTRIEAALWLNGQLEFATATELWVIQHLHRTGLAEFSLEDSALSRYHILSRCICCPTAEAENTAFLSGRDKWILTWLTQAGIRLSLAELICLAQRGLDPHPRLLHKEHRQTLAEAVYTTGNIEDGLLETQMEHADVRDEIVNAILRLLRRKKWSCYKEHQ